MCAPANEPRSRGLARVTGKGHWRGALAAMSRDFVRCRFFGDGRYRRMGGILSPVEIFSGHDASVPSLHW